MLDPHGFVATCNSTHFFIVRRGEIWTSTGDYCLDGITRGKVIEIGRELGLTVREKNFTLTDVYNAEEAFVTGTFAGLVPVTEVDGRVVGEPGERPMITRLQDHYRVWVQRYIDGPAARIRGTEMSVVRIAMWSGPRNISTALMRAFENRDDTVVVDEPLYGHYLKTTGLEHPAGDAVMATQVCDWRQVATALTRNCRRTRMPASAGCSTRST